MGGGDLNLKKSWHPSTLKNIERVWKAEQKHEAEQQKIEQLQKELAAERAREEIHAYAEDQGVVRKRDERLDWMYQGPAALVNREDYLMGRKIDKTFELLQMQENGESVDKEDVQVGSVFRPNASTSNVTVDLATKIREDPLFAIMKREKEQRKNLLNNPVKMKQLKQMLEKSLTKKTKNKKSSKKKDKKRQRSESSSSDSSSSESSDGEQYTKQRESSNKYKDKYSSDTSRKKSQKRERSDFKSHSCEVYTTDVKKSRHSDSKSSRHEQKSLPRSEERYSSSDVRRSKEYYYSKEHKKTYSNDYHGDRNSQKHGSQKKRSSAEMEKLRQEMMENAKWRDNQRQKNVERYIKEGEMEDNIGKGSASAFIRPMLSKAVERDSVENRVKQKIFTIQRKHGAMDSNFARR